MLPGEFPGSIKEGYRNGGRIDSSRFRTFVSIELGVSPEDMETIVLGGHGDLMVPLPRFTTVKGIPITVLDQRTMMRSFTGRGMEVLRSLVFLRQAALIMRRCLGSCQMVKSIIFDERRVFPALRTLAVSMEYRSFCRCSCYAREKWR